MQTVFDDIADPGRDFPSYGRQATVVNHRIWRQLFRQACERPELVYIELENIVARLLQADLFDPASLCHQLFFDPQLRAHLIDKLDGQPGCWQQEALLQACTASNHAKGFKAADAAQGTMLFWGVDARGRKIPLCVRPTGKPGAVALFGIDDRGQSWTHQFTPDELARGLRDGSLLPSIFTSYLVVAIARGIECIGGYYQAVYLPIMRKAVIETLCGESPATVRAIGGGKIRPDLYLSGMQAIGLQSGEHLVPAGPLEIIASGGLSVEQYERIGEVTVLQSHVASLFDTILDVVPGGGEINRSKQRISRLVQDSVGAKIVNITIG